MAQNPRPWAPPPTAAKAAREVRYGPRPVLSELVARAAGATAEAVDRAFVRFAFRSRRASSRGTRDTTAARLDEAAALYPQADAEGRLFEAPAPATLAETPIRPLEGGGVVDLAWPSTYRPIHVAYDELQCRYPQNRLAQARWFRHHRPAPALVCLHGWGEGHFGLGALTWRARSFYRLGLDVVLAVLPLHSRRGPGGLRPPPFPTADPIRSNEGFAQAVSDLRALILALRGRGAPAVAVGGMSLGGFTTALLATVEPGLDAVLPIIPFASLPEILWEHGARTEARRRADRAGVTFERFANAFTATTPLRRPPRVPGDRVLIAAGERDRVTPLAHALRLRDHFARGGREPVRLVTLPGSHLLQAGRSGMFEAVAQFLRERGLGA